MAVRLDTDQFQCLEFLFSYNRRERRVKLGNALFQRFGLNLGLIAPAVERMHRARDQPITIDVGPEPGWLQDRLGLGI